MSSAELYLSEERQAAALQTCAELFEIEPERLQADDRRGPIAHARLALYAGLRRAGGGLVAIGAFLRRDHTTVIAGVRAAEERAKAQPDYEAAIDLIAQAAQKSKPIPSDRAALLERLAAQEKQIKSLERRLQEVSHAAQ